MRVFIWTMVLLTAVSCQTVVDIDLPERDSKLTVNAFLRRDSFVRVDVHASKAILDPGDLESVSNATISISGSNGTKAQETGHNKAGLWQGAAFMEMGIEPKEGVTYEMTGSAPGFTSVFATTTIPSAVQIQQVDTGSSVSDGYSENTVTVHFTDPSEANLYELQFYLLFYTIDTTGGRFRQVPIEQEVYAYSNDENNLFGDSYVGNFLFTDEFFNGRDYSVRVSYSPEYLGYDSNSAEFYFSYYLVSELRSVTEEYYQFRESFETYLFSNGDPFSEPAPVFTNVEGGFGIVAGYNYSRDTVRLRQGLIPSPLD